MVYSKQNPMKVLNRSKVMYVSSAQDDSVMVAFNIHEDGNVLSWFDTIKERIMEIEKVLEDTEDKFAFLRASDRKEIYEFVPMTLEIYRAKVKDKLISGRDFDTEKVMHEALINTIDQSW